MQGEIWDVNLNPIKGSEQKGIRPAVIISGNAMNNNYSMVIVCPLTSSIKNYLGNVVLDPSPKNGLTVQSEVLTFHIRSISKQRLIKKRGYIATDKMQLILNGLSDILKY